MLGILSSSIMLKAQVYAENAMEESALEFYEDYNCNWRAKYKDASLAPLIIGSEFLPFKRGYRRKTMRYMRHVDMDLENRHNGWSCLGNRCRL